MMRELILYWNVLRARWVLLASIVGLSALVALAWGLVPRAESWTASAVVWFQPGPHGVVVRARLQSQSVALALGLRPDEGVTVGEGEVARVILRSADPARPVPVVNALVAHVQAAFESERAAYRAQLAEYRDRQADRITARLTRLIRGASLRGSAGARADDGVPDSPVLLERWRELEQKLDEWRTEPAPMLEVPALVLIDPAWRASQPAARPWWVRVGGALVLAGFLGACGLLCQDWWIRERSRLHWDNSP